MDDIVTTINFSLGKNQTVDNIVDRLRGEAIKETDDGICYSCGGNFQTVTHYSGCVVLTLSEAADEIERLTEWRSNALLALDKREDEIERLRALCNDLYHDATCADAFCRLCGEGIKEWESHRG